MSSFARRRLRHGFVLGTTALAMTAGAVTPVRAADTYPSRVIRIVAPTAPGGGSTVSARLIAEEMAKRAGRQVAMVDNRPGAGTRIGSEIVAKAAPDGYTLLMTPSTIATNPTGFKNMPYDGLRDFAPITLVLSVPSLFVVHPSLPAKSLQAFIALAKSRPGEILYGSAGYATNPHLTIELLASMAKIRMTHVAYQGGAPSIVALMSGEVALTASSSMSILIPHLRAHRLNALGITSARRNAALPEIPTIAEGGLPGYESMQWAGLVAPAGTPRPIIDKLHKDVVSILRSPQVMSTMAKLGTDVATSATPEEFAAFIRAETVKWAAVAKAAGIEPK